MIEWGERHQVALEKLISAVTNSPVLTYPDFSKDFTLHVDVSKDGFGCVLYHRQQDQLRMIGYGSRTPFGVEKRYHSSTLEYLALKWVVCDHFKVYLYYIKHCNIFTDNNPLFCAMSTANLNATGQRWASELCDYPVTTHYKQGIQNKVADCLSRSPIEVTVQHQVLSTDEIRAILSPVKNQDDHQEIWVATLAVTKQPKTDSKEVFSDKYVSSISKNQAQQLQHEDPVTSSVIKLKKQKLKPTNKERRHSQYMSRRYYVIGQG